MDMRASRAVSVSWRPDMADYCGFQWRDGDGEHMCFDPLAHPRDGHVCECDARPGN